MLKNKELMLNFGATALAFLINAIINFILSSYIVSNVSEEAYGFVQFANTFINYFTVITLAINSMSSRFITVEYYKKDINEARDYYSATFWANIILVVISIPILTLLILNLEKWIQISPEIVNDVKLLFSFLAANLLLGLITVNLSVSYYIKNKLYIQSIVNMIGYVLKAALLYILYINFPPYVAFVGIATLIITMFAQSIGLYYKKKLIPEIKIGKFNLNKIKVLITSGIWNSITRIGNILSDGLDLFITNIFLSPAAMGILAIVKIIPNIISSVLSNLVNIFMPNMLRTYAEGTTDEFVKVIKKAMQFVGVFLNIPIICIISLGDVLFSLWFPSQNSVTIHILSILSILQWVIIGPVSIIHNVFTVINKIKTNSLLVCLTGFLNIVVVFILLNITNLGIYAVVSISSLFSILRNLLYTLPFGAKHIGKKWNTFFPEICKSLLSVMLNVGITFILKFIFKPQSWLQLLIIGCIVCMISLVIGIIIMVDKEDKEKILSYILKGRVKCQK